MGANYSHTQRVSSVSESEYNADHQNHIDNGIPSIFDDYSQNLAEMQATTDPGESGSESLATTLAGELERIRFCLKEMKGTTYWYQTKSLTGLFVGAIVAYGGTGTPSWGLICSGANVSRTTYAALFAAIGTTWGAGDGVTTFTLPDLRRRTLVHRAGTGTATLGNSVGDTGGAETVSIAHTHTFSDTVNTGTDSGVINLDNTAGAAALATDGHTHSVTVSGNTGAMSANATPSIIQPSAVVGYFIVF